MNIRFLTVCLITVLPLVGINAQRQALEGTWIGQLTGEVDVDMVFHFEGGGESLSCKLDIPTYQIADLPADEVSIAGDSLKVSWEIGAAFKGKFIGDTKVSGIWFQPAGNLPLTIQYSAKGFAREQDPSAPLPYQIKSVEFTSGGTTLRGELNVPSTTGPHKAVVMVSPSGPQNRTGEMYGHKPQLVVADRLTRAGIAVLRLDDRGVEGSEGSIDDISIALQAQDIDAAVQYLRNLKSSSFTHVGLMGFGEGGSASIILASRRAVDFLITAGTPGVPYADILIAKSLENLVANQASPEDIKRDTTYARSVYSLMNNKGELVDTSALRELASDYYSQSTLLRSRFPDQEQFVQSQFNMTSIPWFGSVSSFDPSPYVRQIACPTLVAYGSEDKEVLLERSSQKIQMDLEKAPVQEFEVRTISGLNHVFQPSKTGLPSEYSMISTTFDENTMNMIAQWINSLK